MNDENNPVDNSQSPQDDSVQPVADPAVSVPDFTSTPDDNPVDVSPVEAVPVDGEATAQTDVSPAQANELPSAPDEAAEAVVDPVVPPVNTDVDSTQPDVDVAPEVQPPDSESEDQAL